ncbi:glycosyltransferase family 2 protein [Rhizobium sp. CECT 9324]|uniref:glycosyltransferase family 2 protein n=1 Tax=Rhizobium sp. CECT 9324 TaxID=2845820 RepID=UPI001EF9B769|nr:glycosyltransferase family 2 protein [Rhizobium sp. CECT 9324]CAH0343192.1 hypothetical protein RHI9324_04925 [Rhizobium sp. CECT 9324]
MSQDNRYPVAILLATYNGSAYLEEFLESLCMQSFRQFRVYVRDDGSTDNTLDLIAGYKGRLDIQLIASEQRLGAAKSFFELLRRAPGHQYYMFADQDDYWYPNKIARVVSAMEGCTEEIVLYCSRLEYVDSQLRHLSYSRRPRLLSFENAVVENIATGCTVAIKSVVIGEVLAREPYDVVMHDWWLYMYCSAFGRIIYDPEASIKYRQHGGNAIGAAVGPIDDFRRRWRRYITQGGGVHPLSRQAQAFLECYKSKLSRSHRSILERVVDGKKTWKARVSLFLSPPVSRQSRIDSFIMRFLFLLGRY